MTPAWSCRHGYRCRLRLQARGLRLLLLSLNPPEEFPYRHVSPRWEKVTRTPPRPQGALVQDLSASDYPSHLLTTLSCFILPATESLGAGTTQLSSLDLCQEVFFACGSTPLIYKLI